MPSRRDVVVEQLDELRTDLEALWVALTKDPKKEARKERAWMLFTGALGAVAALGARRAATRAWGVLTGEAPPGRARKR
jgi:surfactin synthase thioesterase subunit